MEAFEIWKKQGRSEEQIFAVKNFLTGAGRDLVGRKELIGEIEDYLNSKLWQHFTKKEILNYLNNLK